MCILWLFLQSAARAAALCKLTDALMTDDSPRELTVFDPNAIPYEALSNAILHLRLDLTKIRRIGITIGVLDWFF